MKTEYPYTELNKDSPFYGARYRREGNIKFFEPRKTKEMNYDNAVYQLKQGKKVRRAKWKESRHFYVDNVGRYIMHDTTDGMMQPWVPTSADLKAEDWELIK